MKEQDKPKKFFPIPLEGLHTYSIKERHSKVSVKDFSHPWIKGAGLVQWLDSLPSILGARDFVEVVENKACVNVLVLCQVGISTIRFHTSFTINGSSFEFQNCRFREYRFII